MTRSIAHIMAAGSLGAVFLVVTMDHADGQARPPARPTLGRIERLDPGLDSIVAPDAKMEIIGNGYDWTEGPLWVKADGGQLLFSDIPPNRILSWKDALEMLALAHFVGVTRPGFELSDDHLPEDSVTLVEVPAMAISSSACRARVSSGEPVWYLVPDGVVQYINKRGLYRGSGNVTRV